MARQTKKRATEHADFAGPNAELDALDKLSRSAAAANEKTNTGEISDEAAKRHILMIEAAETEWQEARDKASELQGVYRNRLKVAKGDGMDIDALKLAFKIKKRQTGEVISEQRGVGRYLQLMGSPLGMQWSLFDQPDADGAKLDATAQGEQAGREGADRGSNPYDPGTPDWFAYNNGWTTGQDSIARTLGRGNGEASR